MRIQHKFIGILFIISTLLVVAQVLFMQWSIGKGMIDYVNQRELAALVPVTAPLADIYQQQGSWQGIRKNHRQFMELLHQQLASSALRAPPGQSPNNRKHRPPPIDVAQPLVANSSDHGNPPRPRHGPPPMTEYALLDSDKVLVAGVYFPNRPYSYLSIMLEQQLIGYLAVSKRGHLTQGYELNFIEQQQQYILFIALGLLLIALLVAMPLARHFVRPIKQLALAMSQLSAGQYQQRITLKRTDEFSHLSRDFNELATTLEQNEQARKRWLADVSHELRTPVAVLKGEMEAMLDGVRSLNMSRIYSAHQEIIQLEKLLDDLHELIRSDLGTMHYRKVALDLLALLREEARHHESLLADQGLSVFFVGPLDKCMVFADDKRLRQLLANLFSNTAKYAKDGDSLIISLSVVSKDDLQRIEVTFEDNGLGVPEQDLDHLFEHLFRVEDSRNRDTGGSGLGLSICKKIVEAHHGSIRAFKGKSGGLGIVFSLPLEQ
jgi:two-component system sensor histidine kinase BaeS